MNLEGIGDGVLERMVATIVAEVDPERIILFGSRARGDADADSDVDLMVVEEGPFGPERNDHTETVRLIYALADFPVAKDILVCSREEVEYWKDSLNNVVAEALREGEELYERSQGGASRPLADTRLDAKDAPAGISEPHA